MPDDWPLGGRTTPSEIIDTIFCGDAARHLVLGDVGAGKSWFAGQVAAEARNRGATIVEVGCVEFEADVAFLPLALVLSQIGVSGREHAAFDAVLGSTGGSHSALSLGAAVADVLHERSATTPIMVVIDDAHWADSDSLQALLFAARRLDVASVGFVFTAIPDVNPRLDRCGLDQLRLGRWTDKRVVERLVAAGFSTAAARSAVSLTAGNPLAVELLINTVEDDQRIGVAPLPPALDLPSTVAARMIVDLEQQDDGEKRALAVAAALPNASVQLFDDVLDRCRVPAGVKDAIAAIGIVELDPTVIWDSPLVRSAALRIVGRNEILDIHRHVADVASAAGLDDLALRHRAAAGIVANDALASELERAGFAAIDRGALLTAAESFRQAAIASTDQSEKARLFSHAAHQAFGAGNSEQAVPYARAAIEIGQGENWATATVVLGEALLWTEGWAFSDRALCEGARLIGDELPAQAAAMLIHATIQAIVALDATAAVERYERAKHAAERSGNELIQLPVPVVGATAEILAGGAHTADEVLADSVDLAVAALSYEHPIGSAIAELVGFAAVTREDMDQGISLLQAANDAGRQTGSLGLSAITSFLLTDALWRTGQWTQAQVEIGTAVTLARDSGFEFLAECGEGYRAWSIAGTGRRDECMRLAELSLSRTEPLQLRFLSIWAHAAMGLAALSDQDYEPAVQAYDRLYALWTQGNIREPNLMWWHGDHIEALVHSGQTSRAEEALAQLIKDAELANRSHTLAVISKCHALLTSDHKERHAHLDDAITRLRTADTPFDLARCLLARGQHRVEHGDPPGGAADLGEARAIFDRLGARPWSDRASEIRNEAHSIPSGLGDVLTDAELRVALVIAKGAKNKEAAEQLFVSTKTVEYHLSNIYRKLDMRSRVDLVRYISERV